MNVGSPPQVRGKLDTGFDELIRKGITPAGAGKTLSPNPDVWICWDHPRRCGENARSVQLPNDELGSPPQVRGKPCPRLPTQSVFRITPAGAGKTTIC